MDGSAELHAVRYTDHERATRQCPEIDTDDIGCFAHRAGSAHRNVVYCREVAHDSAAFLALTSQARSHRRVNFMTTARPPTQSHGGVR